MALPGERVGLRFSATLGKAWPAGESRTLLLEVDVEAGGGQVGAPEVAWGRWRRGPPLLSTEVVHGLFESSPLAADVLQPAFATS